MSVESSLYSTLNANSGVRALVGLSTSPQSSRIYYRKLPEVPAYPYIEFETRRVPISTLSGVSDMKRYTAIIRCHALTPDAADALADAVVSALEGNGYEDERYPFEDEQTKSYSVILEWSILD